MTDFLYCYLSPFAVGLLAAVAIVCAALFFVYLMTRVSDWYGNKGFENIKLAKTMTAIEKWGKRIWYTFVIVFCAVFLGAGIWTLGLRILKRVACK